MRMLSVGVSWGALFVVASVGVAACGSGPEEAGAARPLVNDPAPPPELPGACVPCGMNLRCVGTLRGAPVDAVLATSTDKSGACTIEGARLRCDGQLTTIAVDQTGDQPPVTTETSIGSWSQAGGTIVVCSNGDCIACTFTNDPPTVVPQQPTPQPGSVDAGFD